MNLFQSFARDETPKNVEFDFRTEFKIGWLNWSMVVIRNEI